MVIIIVPVISLILLIFKIKISYVLFILLNIYIILGFLNLYLSSEYNINMDFLLLMKSNLCLTLGYAIGIFIFLFVNQWLLILTIGMLFTVIYELQTTYFWRERKSSDYWNKTFNKVATISISSAMISIITYADRLFISNFRCKCSCYLFCCIIVWKNYWNGYRTCFKCIIKHIFVYRYYFEKCFGKLIL